MKLDFPAFAGGIRTASALLIGNSVLVYTGVLGVALPDANVVAFKIFLLGLVALLVTSLTRNKL
jgi:hypothetical protein